MHVLNETKPYRLDIRGKICPMTFVYTKLQLEKMKAGELLEIILDFPAAVKNVPDNCKRQGIGELINIQTLDDKKEWILLIKKI